MTSCAAVAVVSNDATAVYLLYVDHMLDPNMCYDPLVTV
jgi:hypothetical protein